MKKYTVALISLICLGFFFVGCQNVYNNYLYGNEITESYEITAIDDQVGDDRQFELFELDVAAFAIDFLTAFNNNEKEQLKTFMTDGFFSLFKEYSITEPLYNTPVTFRDTLSIVGRFEIPTIETILMSRTLFGDFLEGGEFWFIFNLFPTKEVQEELVCYSLWGQDRWNMILTFTYTDNGFLIKNFMHTYDR